MSDVLGLKGHGTFAAFAADVGKFQLATSAELPRSQSWAELGSSSLSRWAEL